jgi:hypothetical protein
MALDPTFHDKTLRVALAVAALLVGLAALACPESASAALRGAAGGGTDTGGFARFVQFINRLADYTIPIGSAFAVLGLIWGGLLFVAGDTRAGRVLGFVALGVGIILLSTPIAA